MLKRNGELIQHEVPGYSGGFTGSELASYNAAFATIERDYKQIENVKSQLGRLAKSNWEMETNPKPFDTLSTPDGTQWKAYGILVNLPRSDVLLCRKDENEWAVIQQLKTNGPYAETHGKASVLLTGNNPRELANEYIGQAEHTLRFMARNTPNAKKSDCLGSLKGASNRGAPRGARAQKQPDLARDAQSKTRFQSLKRTPDSTRNTTLKARKTVEKNGGLAPAR